MDSAVDRTPPDLWEEIFKVATSWLRLPNPEDNLSRISHKWRDCEHFHRYIGSLKTRTALRLVCRSWNVLLDSTGDHPVISDMSLVYWPSIHHLINAVYIDISRDGVYCDCGVERPMIWRKGLSRRLMPLTLPPISNEPSLADAFPPSNIPLKARVFNLDLFRHQGHRLVGQLPLLEALSWAPDIDDDIYSTLRGFRHLTYLNLGLEVLHIHRLTQGLMLPSLECLDISWHCGLGTRGIPGSVSNWSFPRLDILKMTGSIDATTRQEIDVFLSRIGSSITSLVLILSEAGIPLGGPRKQNAEVWSFFPNLSILGVSLFWFRFLTSVRTSVPEGLGSMTLSKPLTIYIPDFSFPASVPEAQTLSSNLTQWCESHSCTIERIAIGVSWRSLARQIYNTNRRVAERKTYVAPGDIMLHKSVQVFLQEAEKSIIPICDCEGVRLDSGNAQWFKDGLWDGFSAAIFE